MFLRLGNVVVYSYLLYISTQKLAWITTYTLQERFRGVVWREEAVIDVKKISFDTLRHLLNSLHFKQLVLGWLTSLRYCLDTSKMLKIQIIKRRQCFYSIQQTILNFQSYSQFEVWYWHTVYVGNPHKYIRKPYWRYLIICVFPVILFF